MVPVYEVFERSNPASVRKVSCCRSDVARFKVMVAAERHAIVYPLMFLKVPQRLVSALLYYVNGIAVNYTEIVV